MKEKNSKNSFSQIRTELLSKRCLWKNKQGKVAETETQMYHRVATTTAVVESQYGTTKTQVKAMAGKFYRMMKDDKFHPNSPTLMNAGREKGMLSACFVLPIEDSIDGIFSTIKNTYTNFIYRIHFPEVPFDWYNLHITTGKNPGLLIIYTIEDPTAKLVLITTVHTCGCYLAFFPTEDLAKEAYPPNWPEETQCL